MRQVLSGEDCRCPALGMLGWSRTRAAAEAGLSPHRHDLWEICLIARGEVEWWCDGRMHTVPAGHWYCTAPGVEHGGACDVLQPCELWWLQFDAGLLAPALPWLPGDLAPALRRLPAVLPAAEGDRPWRALLAAIGEAGPLAPSLAGAAAARLVLALLADGGRHRPPAPPTSALARALARADQLLGRGTMPAVAALAREAGLGPSRFHQRFLAELGETPARWLARRRLQAARHRLALGAGVTATAAALGFASSQHLATAFRRAYGISPKQWRGRAAAAAT